MSANAGGSNSGAGIRLYEGDYTLDFHKGFILSKAQFSKVVKMLEKVDIDGIEAFLKKEFPEDAPIVASILEHQRKLKASGYYKKHK